MVSILVALVLGGRHILSPVCCCSTVLIYCFWWLDRHSNCQIIDDNIIICSLFTKLGAASDGSGFRCESFSTECNYYMIAFVLYKRSVCLESRWFGLEMLKTRWLTLNPIKRWELCSVWASCTKLSTDVVYQGISVITVWQRLKMHFTIFLSNLYPFEKSKHIILLKKTQLKSFYLPDTRELSVTQADYWFS